MRILQKGIYKGRKVIVRKIVHFEEDILNAEKNFETALNVLAAIRKTRRAFFGQENESNRINRKIISKRKMGE
ncbi:MAG: hypothetical protein ABID79_00815 [Elusimicrobiota bacterium]